MATLRDIKRRIRSVQSTEKITKAMEMVAAAKLRRAQRHVIAARPYSQTMDEMLENLATTAAEVGNPLFTARPVRKRLLVVIAADRGLCGSYNANVMRATDQILAGETGSSYQLLPIGRKANEYYRRRNHPIVDSRPSLPDEHTYNYAENLSEALQGFFLDETVDEVELIYTQFISTMSRRVVRERFLPIKARDDAEGGAVRGYIFEPDAESLLDALLPKYANTKMLQALLEAMASEHSARMVAMQSAHKNAGELIENLVLLRNRLRQAVITKEIAEIVGGAEALK